MGTASGYVWRVAVNAFYVLVIWYVLANLHGRAESIVVPVLGLLYVEIRAHASARARAGVALGHALVEITERLKALADSNYKRSEDEVAEIRAFTEKMEAQSNIEAVFQVAASVLCLWKLFTQL
jgi:hypothetical protein